MGTLSSPGKRHSVEVLESSVREQRVGSNVREVRNTSRFRPIEPDLISGRYFARLGGIPKKDEPTREAFAVEQFKIEAQALGKP